MLQIKNLSVSYRSQRKEIKALNNVNLEISDGDICAIIGPSGCGKSTLLNVLSGILKASEGEVLLGNEELSPFAHKISFIPQNFGLLPWKTVEDNILLPFKIKSIEVDSTVLERLDNLMDRLSIKDLKSRYPKELSGGQAQRVSIVRGFLMEPDLLLLDESFSALDAIIRDEAEEMFLDVWSKNKTTTIFVTHSIDEALYMGNKIIVMANGEDKIIEVIDNPLFNNKSFKESENYAKLFSHIKGLVKKGWDK